jgi:hypothetical protein
MISDWMRVLRHLTARVAWAALPLAVAACDDGGPSMGSGGSGASSVSSGQAACTPGAVAACYTGPLGTEGVGLCKGGQKTCRAHGQGWGACEGEVTPVPETCATPGDDDCNGLANESGPDCACAPGVVVHCYSGPPGTEGVGICHGGKQTCNALGTGYGPCMGEVLPQPETCLTPVDDNCDGEINEGGAGCVCMPNAFVACYTGPPGTEGVGPCHAGKQTCNDQGTALSACIGEVTPVPETCATPIDDNCNGMVNEGGPDCVCTPGAVVSCYTGPAGTAGVGACQAGQRACNSLGTAYGPCLGEVLPSPETCYTAADDDCDGVANDHGAGCVCLPSTTASCYDGPPGTAGVGACMAGIATCNTQGTAYGPCVGEVLPSPETCYTAADDDCDGVANDHGAGCVCLPASAASCYDGAPGTEGVGICHGGTKTCDALGTAYGPCAGEVVPMPEDCATPVDDNCNGVVNEPSAGCVCTPNVVAPCYDGPPGTNGVGTCHGGQHTCNAEGTAWGPCGGEVVPKCDDCTTPADEDCDGQPSTCTGGKDFWVRVIGGALYDYQKVESVAADAGGNVILAGRFLRSIDFGGGLVTSADPFDAFVAKLDPGGKVVWARTFGQGEATSVAVDAAGNVLATGTINGVVDLGGGPLAGGSESAFLLELDPSGNHLWSKVFGQVGAPNPTYRVAAAPGGDVVLAGEFQSPIDFGGGPISAPGTGSLFVVRLDASGSHLWSKGFGDIPGLVHGLAVDGSGNVLFGGDINGAGTMDFGGGPIVGAGNYDIFLVKLDASGNHVWSKGFGDPNAQYLEDLRVDAAGDVIVSGGFMGNLDLGGGPLSPSPVLYNPDFFLAKFDPSGNNLWGRASTNRQNPTSVAVDGAGNVAFAGSFMFQADFGAGPVSAGSNIPNFLARYDPSGQLIWAALYGVNNFAAVAADPAGNLLVGGSFSSDMGLCTGPVAGSVSPGFVFKAGP